MSMDRHAPTPLRVWKIDVGQAAPSAVADAIAGQHISQGPVTEELESRLAALLDIPHVVCTTSGTQALLMSYLAAGVGPGTEVIIPDRTWVATANAALLLGARVVVADVRANTPLLDPDVLSELVTPATRVIVPVHLNGRQAYIDDVLSIADKHGITVVEDACQALMSYHNGRHLGTFGHFGCFSMGMAKLLPTGQGGFVVCRSESHATALRQIRNQGLSGSSLVERHGRLGGNFKFTDVQAALALAQLNLLEGRCERQKWILSTYRDGLADVRALEWIEVDMANGAVPLRPEFLCSARDQFVADMAQEGIEVMANSPNLSEYGHIGCPAPLPNAKVFTQHMVTLPGGPDQSQDDILGVVRTIRRVAGNYPMLRDTLRRTNNF